MNFDGIITGLLAFLLIGVFHPIVIKCEYYFTAGIWPVFLAAGILFLAASAVCPPPLLSSACGILGFTCLWSVIELKEQEKRVAKGWFPANPKRTAKKQGKKAAMAEAVAGASEAVKPDRTAAAGADRTETADRMAATGRTAAADKASMSGTDKTAAAGADRTETADRMAATGRMAAAGKTAISGTGKAAAAADE